MDHRYPTESKRNTVVLGFEPGKQPKVLFSDVCVFVNHFKPDTICNSPGTLSFRLLENVFDGMKGKEEERVNCLEPIKTLYRR